MHSPSLSSGDQSREWSTRLNDDYLIVAVLVGCSMEFFLYLCEEVKVWWKTIGSSL
jgi:hypothetical protein